MRATVYQHPSANVTLDDPREPSHPRDSMTHDGVCVGCGVLTKHHWTIADKWVGCRGAMQQQTPPRSPERWNDPWPAVTCEVRKALLVDCGPAMEVFLAGFTHDEILAIAHTLGKAAIAAYTRELAK